MKEYHNPHQNSLKNRVQGHVDFVNLLLSAGAVPLDSESGLVLHRLRDKRKVSCTVSMEIDEEMYQICLDMALNRICNEGGDKGDSVGK